MSAIVVSPHLDDAVLSANARLQQQDAAVVTVFTGIPTGDGVADWDEMTGAECSRTRMYERFDEDDEALRRLGVESAARLGELDEQYRPGAPADVDRIAARLAAVLSVDTRELWLPAAVGAHPDHVVVRDAGLRAAAACPNLDVFLYADFPYVITYGWPTSVTGGTGSPFLRPDVWLAGELRSCAVLDGRLTPTVVALGEQGARRKRHSIGAYRSQLPALQLDEVRLDADPDLLRYELVWSVASGARAPDSADKAGAT